MQGPKGGLAVFVVVVFAPTWSWIRTHFTAPKVSAAAQAPLSACLSVVDMDLRMNKCPPPLYSSRQDTHASLLICAKRGMCISWQFRAVFFFLFFFFTPLSSPDLRRSAEAPSTLSMYVICLNCTSPGGGGMNYKIGLSH